MKMVITMGLIQYSKGKSFSNIYRRCRDIGNKEKKNPFFMFLDIIICTIKYKSGVSDYFNYKFYKKTSKERKQYITIGDTDYFYEILSPSKYKTFFTIKPNFLKNFKKYINRDYWVIDDGKEKLKNILDKHDELIVKPIDGLGGKEVEKIKTKDITNIDSFYEKLKSKNLFIEEVVKQHKDMAKLSPTSCNTIRIMTLNLEGKTEIFMAAVRIGNGVNNVDNFHQGGMGVKIDIKTGKLIGNAFDKDCNEYVTHPKTKIKFDGYQIPNWEYVKKMVLEAAKVNSNIKVVGWDVAITKDKATFIEGNRRPGWDLIQVIYNRGRKDIYNDILNRYNNIYKKKDKK